MIYTFEDGLLPEGWVKPSSTTNAFTVVSTTVGGGQGSYCLKAGTITHSQSSGIEVTKVCAAGNITFYRRVSSEASYDFLRFFIDGVQKATWSGNGTWAQVSYPVTAGTHTFRWTYTKDGSASNNLDTAFIDTIDIPEIVTKSVPAIDFNFIPLAPDLNTILPKAIDFQFDLFAPLYGQYIESPKIDFTFTTNSPAIEQSASIEATAFTLSLESPLLNVIKVPALDLNFTFLASTQQRANPENVLRGFILTYPVCTVFAAHTATYESVPNYIGHVVTYGTTAQFAHRSTYESTSVAIAHDATYALEATFAHTSIYTGLARLAVHTLHEATYASTGLTFAQAIHEATYASTGLNTAQTAHEAIWASFTRTLAQTYHTAEWASTGLTGAFTSHLATWQSTGLSAAFYAHEATWESPIRTVVHSSHDTTYASTGLTGAFIAHTADWQSTGLTSVGMAHEATWQSLLPHVFVTATKLHEAIYRSIKSFIAVHHDATYQSTARQTAVIQHTTDYRSMTHSILLNTQTYKSIVSAEQAHHCTYWSAQYNPIFITHDARYRSIDLRSRTLAGLVYVARN